MVDKTVLEVKKRSSKGKVYARRLRKAGWVPGIIYGLNQEPLSIEINPLDLRKIYQTASGRNVLIDLTVKAEGQDSAFPVITHELDFDPLTHRLMHADFMRIDLAKKVHQHVPVVLLGVAPGIKEGGVLEQNVVEVMVECLPADIPNRLELDVSALRMGSSLHVSDIKTSDKVVVTSPDVGTVVVRVAEPRVEKVEEPVAAVVAEGAPAEGAAEGAEGAAEGAKSETGKADAKGAAKTEAKGAAKPEAKAADKAAPAKGKGDKGKK